MNKENTPIAPKTWSNPQSAFQYVDAARKNLLGIIPPSAFTQKYTTFPSRFGDTHYVSDPSMLREILKTRAADFPKSRSTEVLFEPVIPQSIFIASGEEWRTMHKIMIPIFTRSNVESFEGVIRHKTRQYLDNLDLSTYQGRDITDVMQDLTFKIISQILISDDQDPLLLQIRDSFELFLEDIAKIKYWDLFAIRFQFLPNIRKFQNRKSMAIIGNTTRQLVIKRLEHSPPEQMDFLELLIEAYNLRRAPTAHNIRSVQDNLMTFIVAGHETTALTLAWALYALSFFPDAQNGIASEADLPLDKMTHTESAIKETMRLYPAAPLLARHTLKPEMVGQLEMKKGEGIIIPIIAIHRHQDHWDAPDEFKPNRFVDFTPKAMTYLPFGAGPRICIGASFAMMEAKIILSQIMKQYHIHSTDHEPFAHQTITMRSKNGIQIDARKRM